MAIACIGMFEWCSSPSPTGYPNCTVVLKQKSSCAWRRLLMGGCSSHCRADNQHCHGYALFIIDAVWQPCRFLGKTQVFHECLVPLPVMQPTFAQGPMAFGKGETFRISTTILYTYGGLFLMQGSFLWPCKFSTAVQVIRWEQGGSAHGIACSFHFMASDLLHRPYLHECNENRLGQLDRLPRCT